MSIYKLRKVSMSAAILLLGFAWGHLANANLISILGGYDPKPTGPDITYDPSVERATINCSLYCEGLLSSLEYGVYSSDVPQLDTNDGWSETTADLFHMANNGFQTELTFINEAAGTEYTKSSATVTDAGGVLFYEFVSSARYLLFKLGADPNMFLIRNTSGEAQTYTFRGLDGEGSGLSHFMAVSEPSSLVLLGAGLFAAGFVGRRRRKV